MKQSHVRTVIAGIGGGIAMNLAMLLTFRLIGFGWKGGGFGEPVCLIALELVFWAFIALADGFAISTIMREDRTIGD